LEVLEATMAQGQRCWTPEFCADCYKGQCNKNTTPLPPLGHPLNKNANLKRNASCHITVIKGCNTVTIVSH
jgi:hypothetical protein